MSKFMVTMQFVCELSPFSATKEKTIIDFD